MTISEIPTILSPVKMDFKTYHINLILIIEKKVTNFENEVVKEKFDKGTFTSV